MDNKEKEAKFKALFKDSKYFTVKDVLNVNHKPHPYTIGSKHVADAADNHSGILGKETMDKIPCAAKGGCTLSPDEHTSDNILFLSLKQDVPYENTELLDMFRKGKKGLLKHISPPIDGVTFIDATEKFRFLKKGELK